MTYNPGKRALETMGKYGRKDKREPMDRAACLYCNKKVAKNKIGHHERLCQGNG